MVNTGQPSDACLKCKSRRVKCDAAKPSCGNCLRLGATCPGYPETPVVTFRDDTDKTRKRAERMYRNLQSRAEEVEGLDSGESGSESNRAENAGRRRSTSRLSCSTSSSSVTPAPDLSSLNQVILTSIEALSRQLNRRGFATYVDRLHNAVSMYPMATEPLKTSIELLALSAFADSNEKVQHQVNSVADRMRSHITREMNTALEQLKNGARSHEQVLLAVEVTLLIDCYFYFRDSTPSEAEMGIRTHFDGMSAIVNHAGRALLNTELGQHLYVNVFMCHLHTYSPLTDLPPIPGPKDAIDILSQTYSESIPEYRGLPLLQRSFDLRREALQLFIHQPNRISLQTVTELKLATDQLRHDFERLWARLPAAQKFGGSSMCRWIVNAHWVHRILIEDIEFRCLRALQHLQPQPYDDEFAIAIARARFAVRVICQSLPYSFTEADLPSPDEEPPTFQDILFAWNGHNPLLICSMVDVLTEEQHAGIAYARAACARAAGLKQPITTLPRILLKVN